MSNLVDREHVIELLMTISHQSQVRGIIDKVESLSIQHSGNDKIKELIERKIEENNRKSYKDWGDTSNDTLQ